ncbi:hypothetical protein M758_1G042200 [Ceratodon purpureus]|nr:hypothetical protein M758_1G042200 [Ceratodon purpureus]
MAEPGMASRSMSRSPSRSRSGTPVRDGPPPLPVSPAKSPQSSSPLRGSSLGYEAQNSIQRIAEDYLGVGEQYGSPPKVSDSVLPSNVAADSSSIAALDSMLDQEKLKQEVVPSSAGLEARSELEQTAAAAKYGRLTDSPSDGADIRWYFCKTPLRPNEAAAQVPASEVIGKGDYFRFSLRDSLALEASFVQREEELVSAWWKEYAEVSAGPAKSSNALSYNLQTEKELAEEKLRSLSSASDRRSGHIGPASTSSDYDDDDEEGVGVLVKGGLYEVDLMRRRCIPVYWRGEHRRVLRGHWYVRKGGLDWLPLREDVAEQLEIAYHKKVWRRRTFQPSGLYAARVNLTGTTMGLHALFTGEDANWEANLAVDASGISAMLGIQGSAVKLRRGFARPDSVHPTQDEVRQKKEEELDDYASQVPVRHVVFMVHGIGQRLEKANLVDDVGAFRQTVTALSEQHLTSHQRNAQRILFIPCQWRRELKLGGEVAMEQVTLDGVRALRTMITATVHDVLYYMSPIYCQDIIDSVTRSLNRLYARFIKRNPSFDGKVSLYGHSLGSVLTYDILCHQDTLKSPFPVQSINAAITRNDESEDDMPKIDRLPSIMEHEFISEGETSVRDMLSSLSTDVDSSDTNPTGTPTNETIAEVEAAEEESARENEDVVQEPENIDGIDISDGGNKNSLQSEFTNKENPEVSMEEDTAQKHTKLSEGDIPTEHAEFPNEVVVSQEHIELPLEPGVMQEHTEVPKEDDVAPEHTNLFEEDDVPEENIEVPRDDNFAQMHTGVLEEDDISQEHTKFLQDDGVAQEHREVLQENDVAQEHIEAPKENDIAQEHAEVPKEPDVLQEHTEFSKKNEVAQEHTEVPKENDIAQEENDVAQEHKEAPKENDSAQDHTKVLKVTDINEVTKEVEEHTEVSEGVEDSKEHTEISEMDHVAPEHAEISEEAEVLNVDTAENKDEDVGKNVEEDVGTAEQEILHDLESDNSEKDVSEAAVTENLQGAEQDALQDLAAAEIERALDLVDQVVMEDYEEPSEIDRLNALVATLQEKLRLMENKEQGNYTAPENFPEIREETFDRTLSTNKENLQDSLGSAESGRMRHCTGDDVQESGQSSRDDGVGSMRGNLESSVSARKQHRPFIIYPKLKFKVETFYAVGSPLGMFLALRNIRIGLGTGTEYWQDEGIDEEMPACRLLLNIFHPYDPVAYRLEPLICKEYVDQKPVFIPYHKGGKRIHIGLQEFGEDISMKSKAFVSSIGAVGTRVAHVFTSKKDDSLAEEEERERNRKKPKTYGQMVMERLTGSQEGRIDCMLQDATFEHQYISAISSHTSYWQDLDTALFILKHLYRDIPEEPEIPKEPEPDNVPTMEPLHGTIDDSIDDEIVKPDNNTTTTDSYSSTVASAQDDWDSDEESTSIWDKEDFVAALSEAKA